VEVASGPLSTAVPAVALSRRILRRQRDWRLPLLNTRARITCRFAGWLTLTVMVSVPLAFPDATPDLFSNPQFVLVARLVAG